MADALEQHWRSVLDTTCLFYPSESPTEVSAATVPAKSISISDDLTLRYSPGAQPTSGGPTQVTDGFFKGHGNRAYSTLHKLMHRRYFHDYPYFECKICPKIIKIMGPWLSDRNEHRLWQKEHGIPSETSPITKFTAHHQLLNACPCHLPDCYNVIFAEFDVRHLLSTEDKRHFERTGRPQQLWLPLIGTQLTVRRLAKLEKSHRGNYMKAVWGRYYDFDTEQTWTRTWISIRAWAEDYYHRVKRFRDMEALLPLFHKQPDPSKEQLSLKRISRPNNTVVWKINPGWALLPPLLEGGDIKLTSPWERCAVAWDSEATRLWKQDGMWILIFLRVVLWLLTGRWVWQRWLRDRRARQVVDENDVD